MTREEAKELFRNDKDAYGKPRHIMKNIDKIYDDIEAEQQAKNLNTSDVIKSVNKTFKCDDCGSVRSKDGCIICGSV